MLYFCVHKNYLDKILENIKDFMMEENFDKWNQVKKNVQEDEKTRLFKQRDIFFITMGQNIGFEQNDFLPSLTVPVGLDTTGGICPVCMVFCFLGGKLSTDVNAVDNCASAAATASFVSSRTIPLMISISSVFVILIYIIYFQLFRHQIQAHVHRQR